MKFQLPSLDARVLQELPSPALVVFRERVLANIDRMLDMAGGPARLRPHCKTHKMAAVVRLLLERGITRHKAATVAEVEMLADAGVRDVLLAYNPVGPNISRIVALARKFGDLQLSVTADHPQPVAALSAAAQAAEVTVGVLLDVNVGQNRTGIAPERPEALQLYRQIGTSPGLRAAGLHVYDGHQRQSLLAERRAAVHAEWPRVVDLQQRCEAAGIPVPALVCGGTPTFPVYAEMTWPGIELSPGTCIFHDAGYGGQFPDLPFQPAAAVLTRVVSRPTSDRATLDLGNKAVAADPPRGQRVWFPDFPAAVQDIHNEEHLVLVDAAVDRLQPGEALLGIPVHICPTSALYDRVPVIDGGVVVEEWPVTSRNRRLTI